jgi:hypothetical protein
MKSKDQQLLEEAYSKTIKPSTAYPELLKRNFDYILRLAEGDYDDHQVIPQITTAIHNTMEETDNDFPEFVSQLMNVSQNRSAASKKAGRRIQAACLAYKNK